MIPLPPRDTSPPCPDGVLHLHAADAAVLFAVLSRLLQLPHAQERSPVVLAEIAQHLLGYLRVYAPQVVADLVAGALAGANDAARQLSLFTLEAPREPTLGR